MKSIKSELLQLKNEGVKNVLLNGWEESIEYVISLDTSNLERLEKGSYNQNL
ncbi:hypothetical protein BPT24_090 [Tenacibaculum phage pT24]|uniref:Uncharacterized protein n=1 Tax=Tenacibaculum phage pT24 TaxID=1880590 RepID=A0A1B4XWP7_9CAUD|nr:hypothetical protein HYP10_gp090 [Tenacibaculum phage pT24]BAV39215.1 hypothetical protein BPT24_090 [Tenacibaculum phage pT24]